MPSSLCYAASCLVVLIEMITAASVLYDLINESLPPLNYLVSFDVVSRAVSRFDISFRSLFTLLLCDAELQPIFDALLR